MPRNVLWLDLMLLAGLSNQVSHTGENQIHHCETMLKLLRQRLHTNYKYGLTHQTMRKLHIEARSLNAFERKGKPKLLISERLLLQKLKKQKKVTMVKSTKMTISRPNQSLNDLLTVPSRKRRIHHPKGSNFLMTTSISTLVRVRVKTVRKLLMLHPLILQRSQRKLN